MSRRRASWQPVPPVESDALLTMFYGEQRRKQSIGPVSGCTARCCWPGAVTVQEAESRLWRGIAWALGLEIGLEIGVVAVVALIVAAGRGLGW